MGKKVIITVAVTGSFPTKEMNPAVPYSPEEIIDAAVACHKAGAASTHIHVRDPHTGKPEFNIEFFKKVLDGIRQQCNMIVNLTTSGYVLKGPDTISKRLQTIHLKPDICSLDIGSMNFKDRVLIKAPLFSVMYGCTGGNRGVRGEPPFHEKQTSFQCTVERSWDWKGSTPHDSHGHAIGRTRSGGFRGQHLF